MNKLLRFVTLVVIVLLMLPLSVHPIFADEPIPVVVPTAEAGQDVPIEEPDQLDGQVSQGNSPEYITAPDASAASVTVSSVSTTDGNGKAKTVFNAGDSIRYLGKIKNSASKTVNAYIV